METGTKGVNAKRRAAGKRVTKPVKDKTDSFGEDRKFEDAVVGSA
jgi:hypothetical protein